MFCVFSRHQHYRRRKSSSDHHHHHHHHRRQSELSPDGISITAANGGTAIENTNKNRRISVQPEDALLKVSKKKKNKKLIYFSLCYYFFFFSFLNFQHSTWINLLQENPIIYFFFPLY